MALLQSYRINSSYFTAYIAVVDDHVTKATISANWSIGWHIDHLRAYIARKNWTITPCPSSATLSSSTKATSAHENSSNGPDSLPYQP